MKMSIDEMLEQSFNESDKGHIFSCGQIKSKVRVKFGTNDGSVIPSDHCYNSSNKGIDGHKPVELFFKIKHGQYKYVGKGYKEKYNPNEFGTIK